MLGDFKKFILRGNVIDLAVAVLIGTSFNAIASSLTKDMITPLITAIAGDRTNFTNLSFKFHGAAFLYGAVINSVVSFILIAVVVFFLIVQPINKLVTMSNRNKTVEPTEKRCPECLSNIPIKATRCAFCTTKLKPSKASADGGA
jgi:large conductance mechanosensitive channel